MTKSPLPLSRVQIQILDFIRAYKLKSPDRNSPTFSEIGAALGITSRGRISHHIRALAAAGAITFIPGRWRSIVVAQEHAITIDFPDDVWAELLVFARRANVSPDALVIEALRDRLPYLRSKLMPPRSEAA